VNPTVPLVDLDKETLAYLRRVGAPVSNLYRILGNHPTLLKAWVDFAWTLRGEAKTPRRLRELIILRCAQLAGSDYQWNDHSVMAAAAGVEGAQIDALDGWPTAPEFDDEERLLLQFTDEVVAGRVGDDVLEALQRRYRPDAIVELTMTAAFYVMVPRILDALRIPHDG